MWRLLDLPSPVLLWKAPGESAAPAVLFLHGAGECGRDGWSALRYGWVTHGARDERVPVAESDAIVAALTAHGRPPMYTRYADLDHARTCDAAYGDDVYRAWLAGT